MLDLVIESAIEREAYPYAWSNRDIQIRDKNSNYLRAIGFTDTQYPLPPMAGVEEIIDLVSSSDTLIKPPVRPVYPKRPINTAPLTSSAPVIDST